VGRKAGAGWMARCPAHDDRKPSLSLRHGEDGKVLVRCHAGCEQAQVIAVLRSRGMWQGSHPHRFDRLSIRPTNRAPTIRDNDALAIWNDASSAQGTLVETYLGSRGLQLPLPSTLRFHTGLKHPSGGIWPAMVALVAHGVDGVPLALHRTFFSRDGLSKAPVEPQKMMLGPCRGGAVRLADPGNMLMVGEGIETCLTAMMASGHPVWAALSTSGLRALDLPENVLDVVVLADGDDAGEAAARDCAFRWKREGRRVRIARPPQGMDFNDMLVGHAYYIGGSV
jgi:putative DNA primase/helicase